MTDTISIVPEAEEGASRGRAAGGLSTMLLPELKKVAHEMGLTGVSSMKKSDLVAAIRAAQSGEAPARTRQPRRSRGGGAPGGDHEVQGGDQGSHDPRVDQASPDRGDRDRDQALGDRGDRDQDSGERGDRGQDSDRGVDARAPQGGQGPQRDQLSLIHI